MKKLGLGSTSPFRATSSPPGGPLGLSIGGYSTHVFIIKDSWWIVGIVKGRGQRDIVIGRGGGRFNRGGHRDGGSCRDTKCDILEGAGEVLFTIELLCSC